MLLRTFLIVASVLTALATEPGLAIRFVSVAGTSKPDHHDSASPAAAPSPRYSTLPFGAFHVPTNQPAAFELVPGPFTAQISGYISVDLRAQHTFTVELTGQATLSINGKQILNTPATDAETNFTSTPIRLTKGSNAIAILYTSPINTSATFRLLWSSKNTAVPIPIPANALSHDPTPELTHSLAVINGAYLYQSFQCASCHAPAQTSTLFNAPSLTGIGSRLQPEWIAAWLLDPSSERHARMPSLLRGPDAPSDARAIAAFLSTLRSELPAASLSRDLRSAGELLVNDLHCTSCHTLPSQAASADHISLAHINRKFAPPALISYLQNPQAHYTANPMPNFKLSRTEAESIASFLLERQDINVTNAAPDLLSRGRTLVQKSGCLNCHALQLQNQFTAPTLTKTSSPLAGCLASDHPTAPRFRLPDAERAALHAFLAFEAKSEYLPPTDLTVRLVESLRCNQCHIENNLPAPLSLGGKLRPEWTIHFIAGEIPAKPRPWLKARMPAFPVYTTNLSVGLAALHGQAPESRPEPEPSSSLAKTGETLIGSNGGFSCVACHSVGANNTQLVVESPGVNLAYSGGRLLPSYFRRWLMNPIAIDPGTKMPAYFDAEGRSQLSEFFDGNAHAQISAMWHYIRSLSPAK